MEQCLLAVIASLKDISGEIIIIDNGSTDGSDSFFPNRFPNVKYIYNKENKGFAAANNQGISVATGEYLLLLNPDTLLPEDCIKRCISFLQSKDNNAALGIRMIDGGGRFLKESKRAFPDPMTSLYKLSGLAALFPKSRIFARYYLGHLDEHSNQEVDVLAGAFMMLPRKVLKEVKGFDEAFFMYGEDIDLSYRIQKAGFSNYYFAESTIIHFKGESTKKGSLNYVKMFYKAMSIFVKKHYGLSRAGVFNFFLQAGIALRATLSALSRFLKWIGMPVIDILTIFLCFWTIKKIWVAYLLPYLAYDNRILLITYPTFTILFLITSYYSGLYDNGHIQSRLNKSVLISSLILFTIYALVPESTQFSRGVLVSSVVLAFLMMTLVRIALLSMKIIHRKKNSSDKRTAIAGSKTEANRVLQILNYSGNQESFLGRIAINDPDGENLTLWKDLPSFLKSGVVDEIIYCQGTLSFKDIISSVESLPSGIDAGFFAEGSSSITGSSNKDMAGASRAEKEYYRLENPLYRRVKRLLDGVLSLSLIITFPIHLIIKKRPLTFIKNCIQILLAQKSFVGYATNGDELPELKPSLLTPTGLPVSKNFLSEKVLKNADIYYAKNYSVFTDFWLVYKGYYFLS